MKVGTLHGYAVETNTLMALFASAWEAGLRQVREIEPHLRPRADQYRHIDLSLLSGKLAAISQHLSEKISLLKKLTNDADATVVERDFTIALLKYCGDFRQSVDALNSIYLGLQAQIGQAAGHEYSAAAYEQDLASFREASRRHKVSGALVSDLYSGLGSNDFERETLERGRG